MHAFQSFRLSRDMLNTCTVGINAPRYTEPFYCLNSFPIVAYKLRNYRKGLYRQGIFHNEFSWFSGPHHTQNWFGKVDSSPFCCILTTSCFWDLTNICTILFVKDCFLFKTIDKVRLPHLHWMLNMILVQKARKRYFQLFSIATIIFALPVFVTQREFLNKFEISDFIGRLHRNFTIPSSLPPPLSKLPIRHDWSFTETLPLCKAIVARPLPNSRCIVNHETKACPDGVNRMFSQYYQDFYLYTRHFVNLKRRGIYVDVAANHPWKISNTYFFDECLGWSGICVEANPTYTELLYEQRWCHVVPTCVSDHEGHNVSFVLYGGLSGITETNKLMARPASITDNLERIELRCSTMERILRINRVRVIDYLSLDVEGHELMVLQGIDWDKVRINVMAIEISSKTFRAINQFVTSKGYVRHVPQLNHVTKRIGLLSEDAVYLHKDTVFGHPE